MDKTLAFETTLKYDREAGELQELTNGLVTEAVLIRQVLMEDATRQACIAELERLGYTVLSPNT